MRFIEVFFGTRNRSSTLPKTQTYTQAEIDGLREFAKPALLRKGYKEKKAAGLAKKEGRISSTLRNAMDSVLDEMERDASKVGAAKQVSTVHPTRKIAIITFMCSYLMIAFSAAGAAKKENMIPTTGMKAVDMATDSVRFDGLVKRKAEVIVLDD
jgi:hypothetical protein